MAQDSQSPERWQRFDLGDLPRIASRAPGPETQPETCRRKIIGHDRFERQVPIPIGDEFTSDRTSRQPGPGDDRRDSRHTQHRRPGRSTRQPGDRRSRPVRDPVHRQGATDRIQDSQLAQPGRITGRSRYGIGQYTVPDDPRGNPRTASRRDTQPANPDVNQFQQRPAQPGSAGTAIGGREPIRQPATRPQVDRTGCRGGVGHGLPRVASRRTARRDPSWRPVDPAGGIGVWRRPPEGGGPAVAALADRRRFVDDRSRRHRQPSSFWRTDGRRQAQGPRTTQPASSLEHRLRQPGRVALSHVPLDTAENAGRRRCGDSQEHCWHHGTQSSAGLR